MNLAQILAWTAEVAGCAEVPADSQVYVEAPGDVTRVLFGVDIDLGEVLYAREAGYDAVIAHHPLGDQALLGIPAVVERQMAQMMEQGVPSGAARRAADVRIAGVRRQQHAVNVDRLVGTARLIGFPIANIHLACDIISRRLLVERFEACSTPASIVADALAWLQQFPEIVGGFTEPEVWLGDPGSRLGRWTVAMAGGTNGGYSVFREYFKAGVDTIFTMHVGSDDILRLEAEAQAGQNIVVTGHMATDSIGINVVIAALEARGIAVTRTSGIVVPGDQRPGPR